MKAAVVRQYGPASVVEIAQMPKPEPKGGEVLVRVHATSLNPIDYKLRSGGVRPLLRLDFPAVLGFDFAGEVAALGDGVTGWSEGDRIYGRIDSKTGGTHAEFATVRADIVDRIPDQLSFEEAAGLPLTGMTALQALHIAGLSSGQRLLVNGAAGGVGSLAVQIGRARRAEVVGVCQSDDVDLVTSIGATRVLDYTKGELERTSQRFDVIFDTVFNRPINDFRPLLKPKGVFVTTGFSPKLAVRSVIGKLGIGPRFEYLISRPDGAAMRELSGLVDSGHLKPVVQQTFPLERISDAYRHLEEEHTQGKVVITLRET